MLAMLCPDQYRDSIYDVDLGQLFAGGYRALILDLDNTITRWDSDGPDAGLVQWVKEAKSAGFRLCIVSNNLPERVDLFARALDVPAVPRAAKPSKRAFIEAMKLMGSAPAETACVGDQIFTDVFGAKRLGLYAILVVPMAEKEFVFTRFIRRLERVVLGRLASSGALPGRGAGSET
ncbi:MAG: YqeG family HAD IIIA-type phosphatase [Bacillota bacterium]